MYHSHETCFKQDLLDYEMAFLMRQILMNFCFLFCVQLLILSTRLSAVDRVTTPWRHETIPVQLRIEIKTGSQTQDTIK